MTTILTDLTPDLVFEAMDTNFADYAYALGELPGAEVHPDPRLPWFATGLPDSGFNGVYQARLDPESADGEVEGILTELRHRGLPFQWQIGPTTRPGNLGDILVARGMTHDDEEPAMVLDLNAMNGETHGPADLTIETVRDDAGLRDWSDVWGCGAPPFARQLWWDAYRPLGVADHRPWTYYLGRRVGVPVATVKLFYAAGVVCVHHVVTTHAQRRHGIGRAMTVHALGEARSRGYRIAILTASPLGFKTYERIGFKTSCRIKRYRWQPAMPARPAELRGTASPERPPERR